MKARAGATILVVDDSAEVRAIITRHLVSAGYVVQEARSARQALNAIRDGAIDLVTMDVYMPDMDGFEFLVQSRGTGIPVVALSGGGSLDPKSILDIAALLGAAQTLQKPFTGHELLDAVRAALAGSQNSGPG